MTEPSKIKSEDGYTFYRLNDGRYVDSLLASNLKYCLQFFQLNCGSGTKIIFLNPNIISFSQQSVDQLLTKFLGNHIEIRAVNFIFQPHICGVKKLL
jgi:hypothetical protein